MYDAYPNPVMSDAFSCLFHQVKIGRQSLSAAEAAAVDTDYILDGAVTTAAGVTTITTFAHQPPYARVLTVIAADGTEAHVKLNSTCTITGTDITGADISEVLTFDENQSTAETTTRAFKTVKKIEFSAMDGAAKFDVGYGEAIGSVIIFATSAADRPIVEASLNGVKQTTDPSLTANAELSKNLVDLHSNLNGTAVDIFYYL